jgi:hypothetical protein
MLKSKFGQFVFIFIFSGAVVLLGSKELGRRFKAKNGGRPMKDMVRALHGEVDMEAPRASLARRPAPDNSSSHGSHSDQLDHKDKQELRTLLDRVAP